MRLVSKSSVLPAAALLVTAGLAPWARLGAAVPRWTPLAFILFIAVAELLEVSLPWGSSVTMGVAPAIGFMLPLTCRTGQTITDCTTPGNGPAEVAVVFGIGALLALVIRAARRKDLRLDSLAVQSLTIVAVALVYAGARHLEWPAHESPFVSYVGIVAVALSAIMIDAAIPSIKAAIVERIPVLPLLGSRLRASAPLQLALVSVGSLLALAHPTLDFVHGRAGFPWSFLLILVPLFATQYSFRQFASIRKTYLQTIGALAKVPEMAGYTEPGHSKRVAELSVEIAQEMGVAAAKIEEIQYAALLHDIGRVSLPDPESANESTYRLQVALEGAEIVKQTGYMPGVASIIGHQHEPYRRRGQDQNKDLDVGAKIVKVASAYDDLANPDGLGHAPWDALERMHLGMAYEYDPTVIQSLTRVLEKRGAL
ncbi:MAG: HD-GYP domain-containing protein [Actinomycetota bacterium]|nr:HD domain-containing protein [Actinomycetota bacterium]